MNIRVHFFARARDLAGIDAATLELPEGATVNDLRGRLAKVYPSLANLLERSVLAVHDEFAPESMVLLSDTDVALLPPVSGG
jgi:molybdopterin converting factor subunit 1